VQVFADTRAALVELFSEGEPLVRSSDELPSELRGAWRHLGGGATVWSSERGRGARASGLPLLVIERARASQFTALRSALRDDDQGNDLPADLATLALEGDGFVGQRGRTWQARRGNLHLCRLARLDAPAAPLQGALAALPAVASAEAIEAATSGGVRVGIKWVNDLVLDGRKVGGVLSATSVLAERATAAVLGIGINVAHAPDVPRDDAALAPGSLAHAGIALGPFVVLLLEALERRLAELRAGDGAAIVAAYRERSVVIGRRVSIWPVDAAPGNAPLARGTVVALRDDLALQLAGHTAPITSGRLRFEDG
jgi:biotin-(acetyl-CoA carboxylase) ligase